MNTATWISIVVVVVLVVLLSLYLWATYTSLVTLRARVDEAWRDITLQLQRRAELIPALVGDVRGYADHEQAVFQAIDAARAESLAAADPASASVAESHVQQGLKSVFGVAESFPQLLSSQEFLKLQADLAETADRIQASRRFYNGGVREFNARIQVLPSSLFAKRVGGRREFFEAGDVAPVSEPPRVQF